MCLELKFRVQPLSIVRLCLIIQRSCGFLVEAEGLGLDSALVDCSCIDGVVSIRQTHLPTHMEILMPVLENYILFQPVHTPHLTNCKPEEVKTLWPATPLLKAGIPLFFVTHRFSATMTVWTLNQANQLKAGQD